MSIDVKISSEKDAHEATVDADIASFDAWFQGLGNDALVRSEKAVIKTYLFFKTRVEGAPDGT